MSTPLRVLVLALAVALTGATLLAYLSDTGIHIPPFTGTYNYNTYIPTNTGGFEYTDPVFTETVRRITTDHVLDDIYGKNGWWNATGTRYFHTQATASIINTTTGATEYTSMPAGTPVETSFDPLDPDVYFYFSGAVVHKVTLQGGGSFSDTTYYTAPATLKSLGGSINWLDGTGSYMLLRYGAAEPTIHVVDRNALGSGAYTNAVNGSEIETGGYFGLSPDGAYVVSSTSNFSLNHGTRTLNTTGTNPWDLCGDHGAFLSPSDGRNYKVTFNCNDDIQIWRVDITNNLAGQSPANQKAGANNLLLVQLPTFNDTGHFSATSTGALKNWVFADIETVTDLFNDNDSATWKAYDQEILAIEILTGEIRRMAHHRSRSTNADYYNQPRISAAWSGNLIGWSSNFNQNQVVDIYATPFVVTVPPPTHLRIVTGAQYQLRWDEITSTTPTQFVLCVDATCTTITAPAPQTVGDTLAGYFSYTAPAFPSVNPGTRQITVKAVVGSITSVASTPLTLQVQWRD